MNHWRKTCRNISFQFFRSSLIGSHVIFLKRFSWKSFTVHSQDMNLIFLIQTLSIYDPIAWNFCIRLSYLRLTSMSFLQCSYVTLFIISCMWYVNGTSDKSRMLTLWKRLLTWLYCVFTIGSNSFVMLLQRNIKSFSVMVPLIKNSMIAFSNMKWERPSKNQIWLIRSFYSKMHWKDRIQSCWLYQSCTHIHVKWGPNPAWVGEIQCKNGISLEKIKNFKTKRRILVSFFKI